MKKNLVKCLLSLTLVLSLCFGDFVPLLRRDDVSAAAASASDETKTSAVQTEIEQSEGVIRPEDIDEGLSLYSLDDIRGRRVTVRQPVMEIIKDDIVRTLPKVMDNTYTMLKFESEKTEEEKDSGATEVALHPLAKIDFANDVNGAPRTNSKGEVLEVGNKERPMYPMRGLDRSPKNADGQVTEQKYFSNFTKYMLLRQAYYFNTHWSDIIKNGQLAKHPAADFIYGQIPDNAKAVTMRLVTDPIYRSPMTTGLYLAPGETATVRIKGLKKGETVSLYTHHEDTMGYLGYDEDGKGFGTMEKYLAYWDDKIAQEAQKAQSENKTPDFEQFGYGIHGQWQWQNQKVPCMGTTFNIVGTGQDMDVKIGSMYGGPLYIKPTTSTVEMEIEGAVLTPHFVLGVTTVDEFEKQLRDAPGLIATLDVENGQLIGPAADMRNADDIEKLAYFWHSVFAIDISLNGRDYNYNMTMCYDIHVPAGEAVALNSNFCAQPEYWFDTCMNYEELTTKGNWGTFHELGHVQAKTHGVNWGFCDGDGEVWNNTLILLIYSMLCNMDNRVIGVEHGEYVHPYTAIERSQRINQTYVGKDGVEHEITDYGEINEGKGAHFDQLSMYATLLHSFGPAKFVDMFYTYEMNPAYCANKRADFVYRIGVVDRVNILDWVNENYFARISNDMFTDSQLEFLQNLPTFVPVAYEWANGIDGNETARKHDVDGKYPTVFDLSRDSFSSPGDEVTVLSVTKPLHGTIKVEGDKATYTPPEEITEYDRFDIIVRTEGGRRVTLNVNLRLVYRGVYTEVYDLGSQQEPHVASKRPSIEMAQNYVKGKTPTSTEMGVTPGKANFDHANLEYYHSTFKFRATEAGEHTFYVRADDVSKVEFYKGKDSADGSPTYTINTNSDYNFTEKESTKWKVTLSKGDTIFISAELVNWGGPGSLHIGVRMPSDEGGSVKDIPVENIIGPKVTDSDLKKVDEFKGWQPRFVDSIKNATIDYQHPNGTWTVLSAPVSEGGDDPEVQAQYRNYMVDGDESTAYHTKYNHSTGATVVAPPNVFVIDTGADQTFNYFDIIRRTTGNDKLLSYELYGCAASEFATAAQGNDTNTQGWHELFKGDSLNPGAAKQRLSFARTTVRYFKLIITKNSGHTVIREVYAGIESRLNQTVKPSNYMTNKDDLTDDAAHGFVENSANGKLSTTKDGATFEFKFLGSGFELYADTAPGYGKASVTVDGASAGEIDLGVDEEPIFNKQVFFSDVLEMKEHTVVVTVHGTAPFNISFINVQYGTPVAAGDYPAMGEEYGDITQSRQFIREWKTYVKDYKELTSIQFLKKEPQGYKDTYVRIDTYIRLYRSEDGKKIAFVYPGTILSPIECGSLFSGCEKLEEIDFTNFDTTYMRGAMNMFYGCEALSSVDVSAFKTENVLSFGKMFGNCTSLAAMDLSNFELDENANLYRMFDNCMELETIELPDPTAAGAKLRARARSGEENKTTLELPYVYQDSVTKAFVTEIVLDESTFGHTLKLHKTHSFREEDKHAQKDATCTADGTIAYMTCDACRCNFDNEAGDTLYRNEADLVIPATGHDFVYERPTKLSDYPTCLRPGKECRHYCSVCGIDCPDDAGKIAMPASGHTYMLDLTRGILIGGQENKARADASEEENRTGYSIEYIRREETVKTEMVDEEGNSYYTQEEVVVKGIARVTFYLKCQSYSEWPEEREGEDPFPGVLCCHTTEIVLEFECESHTEATCTEDETFFFDFSIDEAMLTEAMLKQEREHDDNIDDGLYGYSGLRVNKAVIGSEAEGGMDALGHTEEAIGAIPETCEGHGTTAGKKCAVCGVVLEGIQDIEPHGHEYVYRPALEPTCTTAGHSAGEVCKYCGLEAEGVKHYEPRGHEFTVELPAVDATCTELGYEAGHKCAHCDAIEGHGVIEPNGHTLVPMEERAPTETECGLSGGLRCSVCGEVIEEQVVIPPLGIPTPPADPVAVDPPLGTFAWVMIGVGCAAVAAAAAVTVVFVIRKKRRG